MLLPDTKEYSSKYWNTFNDDIFKKIQFLTEYGNLSTTIQQSLLKAKFLALSILDYDFANAIQKYKIKVDVI